MCVCMHVHGERAGLGGEREAEGVGALEVCGDVLRDRRGEEALGKEGLYLGGDGGGT